mgnify:CR=1 FL=1
MARKLANHDPEPRLAIVETQRVKTTAVSGDVGFSDHKQVKGRKRHILVDILGLLLAIVVTNDAVQDTSSAEMLSARVQGTLPRIRKIITRFITILSWIVDIVHHPNNAKDFDLAPKH